MGCKVLQSTIIAAKVTRVIGWGVGAYIASNKLNSLHDKLRLSTRDYFLCAQLLQTDCEYCASLQTKHLIYYRHPDAHEHA